MNKLAMTIGYTLILAFAGYHLAVAGADAVQDRPGQIERAVEQATN